MMKKKLLAILLTVVLMAAQGLALAETTAAHAQVHGILYRATKGENTVYLLGSIHVGAKEMYPFGEAIQKAMAEADTFVFECDTEAPDALQTTLRLMYYPVGTKLKDQIAPALYQKLEQVCDKTGYPVTLFAAMKPWAVMTQLSMLSTAAEMGTADLEEAMNLGVETQVQAYVKENGKQVAYLETVEAQLTMMDQFSMPLQEWMLEGTLDVILDPSAAEGMDASMADWPLWWREGNAKAFADSYYADEVEADKQPLWEEYHQNLVNLRNQGMAESLQAMLDSEPGTYLVTVGLLHLVLPEDSIVRHLEDMGYTVEWMGPTE